LWPGHPWLDHFIYETAFGGNIRRRELIPKFFRTALRFGLRTLRLSNFASIKNADRTFRSHHRNLCGRISKVHIGSNVLAGHHTISPAVGLACYQSNLRHRRFREREQQLRAVTNDSSVFLLDARQKPGHVFEGDQRDVETVTEPHKSRGLDRSVYVEHTRKVRRLIRDNSHRSSIEPRESDDDVLCIVLVNFKQICVVDNRVDYVADVVWNIR